MNYIKSEYWQYVILAALTAMIFYFWLVLYPFIPIVRETSQLFLWTGGYFMERIVIPGGLAQYIGEMISQFFINPVNGAIVYTTIFLLAQILSSLWLRQSFPTMRTAYRFVLSLIVPAILWRLGMTPCIPLTVPIAVVLVMGAGCAMMTIRQARRLWILLPTIPVMYWLTGPATILLVLCCIRWIPVTATLLVACVIGSAHLTPYPLRQVAKGIDYYDYDKEVGKDMGTYEEMECDMLLRQGKWHQIIRKFQQPESPAVRSAVLLAYHKTGQIGKQELMNNLVVPAEQQGNSISVFNISNKHFIVNFGSFSSAFLVSDIAYQLYWTNIAQRAAFEAMEFIPNYNKSGRALKRLVETNIISGHGDVALKYIHILKKTTFYRHWAESMQQLVEHPELIGNYPYLQAAKKEYENTTDIFFI